jgi:ribosomal protein RSM22 (predicted rRNA methylase)
LQKRVVNERDSSLALYYLEDCRADLLWFVHFFLDYHFLGATMQLPAALRGAIETTASQFTPNELARAAAALSQRYQSGKFSGTQFVQSEVERCAYAAMRMPATYAAARRVFDELQRLLPAGRFRSLLDLGAGTGAASWAAAETFDELQQCIAIEQDRHLIQLGKELAQASEQAALREADWLQANLLQVQDWLPHDLVVSSYALGEIEAERAAQIVRSAWQRTQHALVIIEPGTIRGFATVRMLRDQLIRFGGHLVAPCPHAQACPLPEIDWCHFAARVERSALQRHLKGGSLGYEDEKFSYVIFAKQPAQTAPARVLRHPQRQPGFTQLQLCTQTGLQQVNVTKRDQADWKRARKIAWGDMWK